jgi:hypothetical protein
MGFFDIDEFYLPSKDLQQEKNIFNMLERFDKSSVANRIGFPSMSASFNTWDVKCNNSAYGVTLSVSTHCTTFGFMFTQYNFSNGIRYHIEREEEAGHGKVFIKPYLFSSLYSPHKAPGAVVGTREHGGHFCHYNNFKYTNMLEDERTIPKEFNGMVDYAKFILKANANIDIEFN